MNLLNEHTLKETLLWNIQTKTNFSEYFLFT